MSCKNGGLPGIYEKRRHRKALAAVPNAVRRNGKEITELKERLVKLEKAMQDLENKPFFHSPSGALD